MKKEILENILSQNGIILDEEKVKKLLILADLLVRFNEHTNLTAITSDRGIAALHFADCLLGVSCFGDNVSRETLIDVGAGGGFPTLPLAVAFPDLQIWALDSTEKKLRFVSEAADVLELKNVHVISARAEDIGRMAYHREKYTYVTARAVSKLSVISELCLPLLKVGGKFIAYKGQGYEEELKEAGDGIALLGGKVKTARKCMLRGDGEEKTRGIIEIIKKKSTPDEYPRNYSQIKSKPLK